MNAEHVRLEDARPGKKLETVGAISLRAQWGTVREDYSADGDAWKYFPHDHARSRAYRWGEDGLAGHQRRRAAALFRARAVERQDPILKERLSASRIREGNHGEDVKESIIPRLHSDAFLSEALYKYPQPEYPYGNCSA